VLRNGVQVYAREQAFGGFLLTQDIMRHFGMSLEEAESGKRTGSLPESYESDLLRPFMDALALEVSRRCSSSSPRPSSIRTTSFWPVAVRSFRGSLRPCRAGPRWIPTSPIRLPE
jgi:hypothetical protein